MAPRPLAVVTGAAGGIGGVLAVGFHEAGYEVIAVDRVEGPGIVPLNVIDDGAVATFGASLTSLAVLVNAAGILRRGGAEYSPATFAAVLDVNVTGAMRMSVACRAALARAKGSVINIGSMYSFFGAPHAPAYAASKGAVVQMTKSLAVAWAAEGIRVNAIAPGWIETPLTEAARADPDREGAILARTPMARWGTPDDLVGPALFLASDAARFVTGVVLPVDGGYAAM